MRGDPFVLPHTQVERHRDITAALILWLEHASLHGAKSSAMIYSRDMHDLRNVRWLCECIMPVYAGTVVPDRSAWALPNGAVLRVNSLMDGEAPAGHGAHALTMLIAVNAHKWPRDDLTRFASMLRNRHGIPCRYITTGELT